MEINSNHLIQKFLTVDKRLFKNAKINLILMIMIRIKNN